MGASNLKKIASLREMLLAAIAVVVILVIYHRFLHTPQSSQLDSLKQEITKIQKSKNDLESELLGLRLKKEQKQKKEATEKSSHVKIQVLKSETKPDYYDPTDIIDYIANLAKDNQIVVDSLSSKAIEVKSGYSRIPIQLKGHGTFKALTDMLHNLDTVKALILVDSVIMSTDQAVTGEMMADFRLSFFQVEGLHAQTP